MVFGLASMPAASGARPFDVPGYGISVPMVRWATPGFSRVSVNPATGTTDPLVAELEQSEAWQTYGFEVSDSGLGLFLDLTGSIEFRVARVTFADGTVRDVDLRDARRSDGLFELVTFASEERIHAVRLVARARSPQAKIAVRIGRCVRSLV